MKPTFKTLCDAAVTAGEMSEGTAKYFYDLFSQSAEGHDPIAELPWKREREGRPGDRFEHDETRIVVTVESLCDGKVYYRSQNGDVGTDCENTIEAWHNLVTKAMDSGKVTFTAA